MDKAAKQRKQLARDGYTITYGWFHDGWFHSDNERELQAEISKVPYGYDLTHTNGSGTPEWYDHPWTLEKEGVTIYATEPYHIGGNDWADMARLVDEGWDVEIMESKYSVHNPGETIVIWISKDK